ncbi:S8 family serine peptidase [Novosphingobium sp. KN65.2]|uniref:S8 family serine peptidase n=1 Tax=Novosphingobium sp. KN65.2 TaxID=1478134 RepID=UPI0005EA15E2|nr:S8 family serine peptidase [Novosphingobium sp. KN65.2]CDO34270.1 Extracellular protease [Novosphingobium sp. KN65.2]
MMTRNLKRCALVSAVLLLDAGPARAQLGLPLPGDPLGTLGQVTQDLGDRARDALDPVRDVVRSARSLARERVQRLTRFARNNSDTVELDDTGAPARRGEVLLVDPGDTDIALVGSEGYGVIEQGTIEGLDLTYARLSVPEGRALDKAIRSLRKLLPGREITADQIHFPSNSASSVVGSSAVGAGLPRGGTVGVIDGGIAGSDRLAGQRGFAEGAPRASEHASAIASLLAGAGTARLYGADVYGADPAGGNALAIAKAIGWMRQNAVPVVSISLVGPKNALLARAIAAARAHGMVVVAAVGNDGAAAPPAYPASYPGVIAVTGVDGKGRVLIEAGKALHLDYAAPGADMSALVPGKGRMALRGTSFAAPLAAARIAARYPRLGSSVSALKIVDSEAVDGSIRTGRGVLCGTCRKGA